MYKTYSKKTTRKTSSCLKWFGNVTYQAVKPSHTSYPGLKLLYLCGLLDKFSGNHIEWSISAHSSTVRTTPVLQRSYCTSSWTKWAQCWGAARLVTQQSFSLAGYLVFSPELISHSVTTLVWIWPRSLATNLSHQWDVLTEKKRHAKRENPHRSVCTTATLAHNFSYVRWGGHISQIFPCKAKHRGRCWHPDRSSVVAGDHNLHKICL